MREESPDGARAERAPGGQETIVRKPRHRRCALLIAVSSCGGCLALGLALSDRTLRLSHVSLPPILDEGTEIAVSVLLVALVITVVIVLMLVLWCLVAAVRSAGDQVRADRWLDLARRVVCTVTGGRISGLREVPAQLRGEDKALVPGGLEPYPASFWDLLMPAEPAGLAASAVATEDFAAFLERHPRILTIIENQIYDRLTENSSWCATVDSYYTVGAARPAGSWNGQNCTIVLIDIADFGARTRNDGDRRRIRAALYQISQSLFAHPDRQHYYHREDRGDGILLVIPPQVPTSAIVDRILDNLVTLLRRYNSTATLPTRIQMRVALHVGPVVSDAYGVDGRAIIHAARLLDAPALRRHLAGTGADLGFITSPFVYETIIQPNPGPVDPVVYQQLKCQVKKQAFHAWMYLAQASGEIQPAAANVGQIG